MKERYKLSLKQVWMLVSLFSLGLPVFMPSSSNPQHFFENVIGTVTVVMFILSFPSSLFGLPMLLFAGFLLNINPNSIQGLYLNLFLLFTLGYIQWFWIVPRLLKNESKVQILNLVGGKSEFVFPKSDATRNREFGEFREETPLERVFREKN